MMRRYRLLFSLLIGLSLASASGASTNSNAKFVVHLKPAGGPGCNVAANPPACGAMVTNGGLSPNGYFAYLLVANGNPTAGIAGVGFGIFYNGAPGAGVDVFSWNNCATLQFPEPGWPAANRGNLVTWNTDTSCQRIEPGGAGTGVVAVIGYLYVSAYSPDDLKIIPRPSEGAAVIGDCDAIESVVPVSGLGFARFSPGATSPGYNPCTDEQPPSPPTCSITGPSEVPANSTLNTYTVETSAPATTYFWSLTGNGVITGSVTGPSVQVTAGASGSFNLSVAFTTQFGPGQCGIPVSVTAAQPPETCSITGPQTVAAGSGANSYFITTSAPALSYAWTISGNGSIVGPATNAGVTVAAGASGAFTLTAAFTTSSGSGQCSLSVVVTTSPQCSINGPPTVTALTSGWMYTAEASFPITSYSWSITGNGTILGSTTGPSIQVEAGAAGSFAVTADFTSPDGPGQCSRVVTVIAAATCSIAGPGTVTTGSSGNVYTATTSVPAVSYLWTLSGNGNITGPANGSSVTVAAGAPGTFTLTITFTSDSGPGQCAIAVAVEPAAGCTPCGPDQVQEAALATYSAPDGYLEYTWTLTGNGWIQGPTNQPSVQVRAGNPGSFTISVRLKTTTSQTLYPRLVSVLASPAPPPSANANAKILLHLKAPGGANPCTSGMPTCPVVNTSVMALYPQRYYAFVLVADGYTNGYPRSGIAGVQFGVNYNPAPGLGVDVYSWTLCASLEFPSTGWPESGGGNLITWDPFNRCQNTVPGGSGTSVVAMAGYFYLTAYSPDVMQIIPRPVDGTAAVADCYSREAILAGGGIIRVPSPLGAAGFGGAAGYNPCGMVVPIQPTTWSHIKTMYGG